MTEAKPAPGAKDLQQAAAQMPDGPNVAPSPWELQAAQGQVQADGEAAPAADALDGQPAMQADAAAAAQPPQREDRIREAAYALAAERGFQPGHEVADWLQAESRVDAT